MKKIILLVLTFAYLSNLYATDHMAATVAIAPDVKGPVKKVTTTIKLGDGKLDILYGMSKQPFPEVKYVFWYDSIGRLTEETTYPGGSNINGHVYQYHNNEMGVSYHYSEDGFIKGSFKQLFYDSLGNQISSRTYKDGKFFCADSTIYNTQGLKIEHYDTAPKTDSMVLTYSYEYDSIGRLITVNRKNEHIYTIEYQPNGNYTEHHFEKIKNSKPKFFQGFSDNATLTFLLTTLCDFATIYGNNFCSFGMKKLELGVKDNFNFLGSDANFNSTFNYLTSNGNGGAKYNKTIKIENEVSFSIWFKVNSFEY